MTDVSYLPILVFDKKKGGLHKRLKKRLQYNKAFRKKEKSIRTFPCIYYRQIFSTILRQEQVLVWRCYF